jgi:hypothetical protein
MKCVLVLRYDADRQYQPLVQSAANLIGMVHRHAVESSLATILARQGRLRLHYGIETAQEAVCVFQRPFRQEQIFTSKLLCSHNWPPRLMRTGARWANELCNGWRRVNAPPWSVWSISGDQNAPFHLV